jgi:hypothetical protein
MAMEIVCEVSSYKLTKLANDLEKKGFIPISMTSEPMRQYGDYYKCILMHKKE